MMWCSPLTHFQHQPFKAISRDFNAIMTCQFFENLFCSELLCVLYLILFSLNFLCFWIFVTTTKSSGTFSIILYSLSLGFLSWENNYRLRGENSNNNLSFLAQLTISDFILLLHPFVYEFICSRIYSRIFFASFLQNIH